MKLDKIELLKYEIPLICDAISIKWIQNIIAWFYCKRINKKYRVYLERIDREIFLKNYFKNN